MVLKYFLVISGFTIFRFSDFPKSPEISKLPYVEELVCSIVQSLIREVS